MNYVSTRNSSNSFKFEDVFIKGLADDGGLFVPKSLHKYNQKELLKFKNLEYKELAKEIIYPFIGDFMSENDLSKIIDKSYSVFRKKNVVELVKIGDRSVLELFHGPTLAFKDVAMQLLGNFYEYYLSNKKEKINIVVATSGDTGAAAIDAIKGKENINIFVLHPNNRISPVQRKLMTTGKEKNVFNIAVEGSFDDCQNIVKAMFTDKAFANEIKTLLPKVAGVRRFGAAALDLAYVAAGRVDGFWERGLSSWDMAAGIVLVREAGGIVTDLKNASNSLETGDIIAANDILHDKLLPELG